MEVYIKQADGTEWRGVIEDGVTPPPTEPKYKGWRCLHMAEGGYPNADHMPIVRPSTNVASVVFTKVMQLTSYRINVFNILYTGMKWRSTYNGGIAFTNNQGFDDPGAGPRADYVNLMDLKSPLPKLMKGIICGGSFYTGVASNSLLMGIQEFVQTVRLSVTHREELLKVKRAKTVSQLISKSLSGITAENTLTMTPGIDAADATKPIEDIDTWAQTILDKHWYFTATTRAGDKINNFPQGVGLPVYISYFLNKPAVYPLSWFERWWSDDLPDPLQIYHPI